MIKTDWHGCYSQGWGKNLVPASYAHPAKVSFKLAERIYQHAIEEGWVKAGSIVCDPFTGISGFGLHAMINGLHFIGVELEQKFVDLGSFYNCPGVSKKEWVRYFARGRSGRVNYKYGLHWCPACNPTYERNSGKIPWTEPHFFEGNIALWERKFRGLPGLGTARVVQGDSRELKTILAGADICISSPPFLETGIGKKCAVNMNRQVVKNSWAVPNKNPHDITYGTTPGQLGNMPEGKIPLICSSPPYSSEIARDRANEPYAQSKANYKRGGKSQYEVYGRSEGQLANMKEGSVDLVASSPPFETCQSTVSKDSKIVFKNPKEQRIHAGYEKQSYPQSTGQLGNTSGDTFWAASKTILAQCFDLLKPGGHGIFVCKDFIRDGARVPFSQNWADLCESVGFKLVCWHRAMLVKEHGVQLRADGEEPLTSERKSFFRRNIETKKKAAKFWPTLAPDVQAEWVEKAQGLVTKPTEKKVLAKAQVEAFKALCFDDRPYRDELMIDAEDVLCLVKE